MRDEARLHGTRTPKATLSTIGYQLSAISYRLSVIGYRLSPISYRLSRAKPACAERELQR